MNYRPGALGAILDEYERAIRDLQTLLTTVTDEELLTVFDPDAPDPNCRSIQTVLAHVIRAWHNYAIHFASLDSPKGDLHPLEFHPDAAHYIQALDQVHAHTAEVLSRFPDTILDQFDPEKRIHSHWGQSFDPEQLLEHAIVHILRHRRQITRLLERLRA